MRPGEARQEARGAGLPGAARRGCGWRAGWMPAATPLTLRGGGDLWGGPCSHPRGRETNGSGSEARHSGCQPGRELKAQRKRHQGAEVGE